MRPVNETLKKPVPREAIEVLLALALILWRAFAHPLSGLVRDWVALLAVIWIAAVFGSRSRAWPWLLAAGMAALFVLYAGSQGPQVLAALGLRR
jgi:hypothetical protein